MVRILCDQCGTTNQVDEAALLRGVAVCRRCMAQLSPAADDQTAAAAPPGMGGEHAWLAALDDPGDYDLGALAGTPAPPPPSSLLPRSPPRPSPPAPSGSPATARPGYGLTGAFRFGEDEPGMDEPGMDEATRLDGGLGPVDFDERVNPGDLDSTRVVAAPGQRPMARPAPLAAWRIKGERGLVYEMQSVNAVVAWLEGKREIRTVQLAKADGPFKPVDQYPEIASRLQKRPEPAAVGGGSDEPLTLDLSARPQRASEASTRPARPAESSPGGRATTREQRGVSSARSSVAREGGLGFKAVLLAVVGSLGLSVAVVAAGIAFGDAAPPAPPPPLSVSLPPPGPGLARALQELEAGHNTAAVKLLEGLPGGSDPRIDRSLALVLHRTGRDREARAALERYRRGMLRVSGDHGRQVREMRD